MEPGTCIVTTGGVGTGVIGILSGRTRSTMNGVGVGIGVAVGIGRILRGVGVGIGAIVTPGIEYGVGV